MHQTNKPSAKLARISAQQRSRSYQRRLKAAGIDNDNLPEDADEFRFQLARQICMYINQWRGCPERICARNQGCMAPNNTCANAEPLSAEEMEREWPRVQVEFYNAVHKIAAKHGTFDI